MGLVADITDDEIDHYIINDYEEFVSELDLEVSRPKRPDPLCSVKSYNRHGLECQYVNSVEERNSDDGKIVEVLAALKLRLHVPLHPQL